jgi:WD40 repeat protein
LVLDVPVRFEKRLSVVTGFVEIMAHHYTQISGKYRPRQVEFHPFRDQVLFGTVKGNLCLSDLQQKTIQYLGNYGNSPYDAILGLCWLKGNPNRFISGSSTGRLVCGDVRCEVTEAAAATGAVSHVKEYDLFDELTSVHTNSTNVWLLVSGYEKKARVYYVETGTIFMEYSDIHNKAINISRFMNHSPYLLSTSSFDGTVKSWDMRMKQKKPIYEIATDSGYVVMINYSPDDNYLLVSGQDNEITQYLTIDGRRHTSFDVPCTGLLEHNYTRAYYSSSGAYIVTGACEDSAVSMLCTATGRLLNRFEVYPNRKHHSLYVQVGSLLSCCGF